MSHLNHSTLPLLPDRAHLLSAIVMALFMAALVTANIHVVDSALADVLKGLDGLLSEVHRFWKGACGGGRSAPVAPALRSWRYTAEYVVRFAMSARVHH
ncbi:MAG TPA: hypothetical protein VMK42_06355 [Anaeromyxobacteraceae bacterium]|nr:hypothetical protein [Anaeromyxobacteraceae bacterium]